MMMQANATRMSVRKMLCWPSATVRLTNFKPIPVRVTTPMMIPTTAQAVATAIALRAP